MRPFGSKRPKVERTFPLEWAIAHTRRSCDGRQEGREGGYYDLHRYLNNTLFHASPPFRLILVEAIVTIVATVVATAGVVTASGIGAATLLATLRSTLAL